MTTMDKQFALYAEEEYKLYLEDEKLDQFVVDIQGYTKEVYDGSNDYKTEFIIKEVAFISLKQKTTIPTCYVMKPPYLIDAVASKNYATYSGISWNEGEVPYERVQRIFEICTSNSKMVWAKGADKINHMKKLLPEKNFHNVDEMGCPDLAFIERYEPFNCLNHSLTRRPVCAQKNVLTMKSWILDYYNDKLGRDVTDELYYYYSE